MEQSHWRCALGGVFEVALECAAVWFFLLCFWAGARMHCQAKSSLHTVLHITDKHTSPNLVPPATQVSAKEGQNVRRMFEDSALRVLRHPLALDTGPARNYVRPAAKKAAKSRWPCFGRFSLLD